MKIKAFAKVNIGLEVLNKRQDGYHEINTVMSRINLYDTIEIQSGSGFSFKSHPNPGCPDDRNLVYMAAILFKNRFEIDNFNVDIILKKNIPSGAGLGGGSSDAAYTLLALNDFFQTNANISDLSCIAAELGSDVSFFLNKGSAVASGKGEALVYFDYEIPYWTVVIFPGITISTGEAYRSLNRGSAFHAGVDFRELLLRAKEKPEQLRHTIWNDFETPAFGKYPEIKKIKNDLYKYGAIFALLSGSGSSVYGFYRNREEADLAARQFAKFESFVCEPLREGF